MAPRRNGGTKLRLSVDSRGYNGESWSISGWKNGPHFLHSPVAVQPSHSFLWYNSMDWCLHRFPRGNSGYCSPGNQEGPSLLDRVSDRLHDDGARHRGAECRLHRWILCGVIAADESRDIQGLTLPGSRVGHTCHRNAIHGPDGRTCQGNETYISLDAARGALSDRHPPIQRLLDKRFDPLLSLPE